MEPTSYMLSVVDRNVVMRRMTVICRKTVAVFLLRIKRNSRMQSVSKSMLCLMLTSVRHVPVPVWGLGSVIIMLTPVGYDVCTLHVAESFLRIQQIVS